MRWWRSNQRFGGRLALFALWLQLVASFAHFHPESLTASSGAASLGFDSTAQLSNRGPSLPATSTDRRSKGLPHDSCAICASNYLISSALIERPPVLTTPIELRHVSWRKISESGHPPARYASFRARAPPIA